MLGDHDAGATLAVSDFEASRKFYEDTLGLTTGMAMDGCSDLHQRSVTDPGLPIRIRRDQQGHRCDLVGRRAFDPLIESLRGKGVMFEHYDDLPGTTREGDIHTIGEMRGVWFKDPDGNILSIVDQ